MNENGNYLLKNLDFDIPICHWIMYLENFLGKEKAEEFFEYLIDARNIMRKNDIRTIINRMSLSVYSLSSKEQLAFVGIFKPINRNDNLIKGLEDGVKKAQKLYNKKDIEMSKEVKSLGYSYTTIYGNWKDKTEKDTYQRERIFIIFSEKENPEKFKNDICNLVKKYKINSVLITDPLEDDKPKTKIISKLYDTQTGNELEKNSDTTIDVVEEYFTNLQGNRFVFKIPYENNKKVLHLDEVKLLEYYNKDKQERVRKAEVCSMNMGMYKNSLLHKFADKNYNV